MTFVMAIRQVVVLALALLVLNPPQSQAQLQTAEAPILRPGSFWVFRWEEDFRGKRTGTYRRTVVRKDTFEGQEVYILSRGDGTLSVVDSDLQTLAVIDDSGQVKTRFRQGGDRIFPLVVGKTYTREYDNPVNRYRGNYKYTVTGVEEVRTEAGTFTAFRISEEGRGTYYNGAPFSERGVLYIAPSAKFRVKYSFEVDSGYKYSEELVSYQVVRD